MVGGGQPLDMSHKFKLEKNHCKDCRWWARKQNVDTAWQSKHLIAVFGTCNHKEPKEQTDPSNRNAWFEPHESFGCVHFEEKENERYTLTLEVEAVGGNLVGFLSISDWAELLEKSGMRLLDNEILFKKKEDT